MDLATALAIAGTAGNAARSSGSPHQGGNSGQLGLLRDPGHPFAAANIGMALLYRAELRPTKLELLESWAPIQPWFVGDASAGLISVASFRFDDPEGEVGIETLLVRAGDGPVLQVPLTYRGAPLPGGDDLLIGTLQHSVLGQRWVYDAVGDPAYVVAAATAALTGGVQAEQFIENDGELVVREPTTFVIGSGRHGVRVPPTPPMDTISTRYELGATILETKHLRLVVARWLSGLTSTPNHLCALGASDGAETHTVTGTWTGHPEPEILIFVAFLVQ